MSACKKAVCTIKAAHKQSKLPFSDNSINKNRAIRATNTHKKARTREGLAPANQINAHMKISDKTDAAFLPTRNFEKEAAEINSDKCMPDKAKICAKPAF